MRDRRKAAGTNVPGQGGLAAEPSTPMVSVDMTSYPSTPPIDAPDAGAQPVPPWGGTSARPVSHPLGPVVVKVRLENPVWGRLYAAGLALAAVAILVVAARLAPGDRRLGTHRQLGLPPCGFVTMTGFPCPTCGMTTAHAFMVHGRILDALRSHVAGSMMAVGMVGVLVIALCCAVTGRYAAVNWYRVDPVRVVWIAALVLVGSWALNIVLGLCDGSLPVR